MPSADAGIQFTVMRANHGVTHLGSRTRGMRTFCGKLLNHATTQIDPFDHVGVSCKTCRRTSLYELANLNAQRKATR